MPWWRLFIRRPGGGGLYSPPRISETTRRILKIQTALESPEGQMIVHDASWQDKQDAGIMNVVPLPSQKLL